MSQHEHFKFNGALLDNYLAAGYYRMGQYIFTTDTILHDARRYFVFWLRFPLANFQFEKKAQKLLWQNRMFRILFRDFSIDPELEQLYARYTEYVNFDAPPTLQSVLFGEMADRDTRNAFDSGMIEVRDGDTLVAAGIYDQGARSLAGIMNFYDPLYKRYSPGKFLMLQKIRYAMDRNMEYYYPGYIAHGYPKFDYKLFPNPSMAQMYDPVTRVWMAFSADHCEALVRQFLKQMK